MTALRSSSPKSYVHRGVVVSAEDGRRGLTEDGGPLASTPGSPHSRCAASAARAPRPPRGNRALHSSPPDRSACPDSPPGSADAPGPQVPGTSRQAPFASCTFPEQARDLTPFASINLTSEKRGLSPQCPWSLQQRRGRALTTRHPGLRDRHCNLNSCVHMHACVCT